MIPISIRLISVDWYVQAITLKKIDYNFLNIEG